MEMVEVESSNLKAIGYDEENNILYIDFKNSGTYKYFDVEKNIYDGFFNAESIGKYFDRNIKKVNYEYTKI